MIQHEENVVARENTAFGNAAARAARKRKRTFQSLLVVCIFVLGLGCGVVVGSISSKGLDATALQDVLAGKKTSADFTLFWDVWNATQKDHITQPVNEQEMLYGAIHGMVAGLNDPYSTFFSPEETTAFMNEINGDFEGIGAEIGMKKDQLVIIAPLPDSPAEKAGVRAGDMIMAVNGVDARSFTVETAVKAIRGDKGTQVTLTIQRESGTPFDVTITRDSIHEQSVIGEVVEVSGKRIQTIEVRQFNNDTMKEVQSIVAGVALQKPDGIIVDLRNNPGGYLDAAVDMAGLFLPSDTPVVYEKKSDGSERPYKTKGASPFTGIPTVVLMNEGSASASEILAGALRDYQKATVIGKTSYGKGTVQDVRSFDDGSSLKLTIAEWLTPNKAQINEKGIVPDYYVDLTLEDFDADRDPQMDAATLFFTQKTEFDVAVKPPTDEQKKNTQHQQ